jgi:surface polysaccharide O-acyltransferase-like enzyme
MIWLDNSRIIAIFSVVFLHTAASVVLGNSIGTEYWWIANLYDSFVRWCVPVLVMISGALLLDPVKKEDLSTFYRKRFSKIFAPILFWTVAFLLWSMLKVEAKGDPLLLMDLLKGIILGKPYYHLWFLYMLITLYLFTPFFRKIIANSSRVEITIFVIFTFFIAALNALVSSESKLFVDWFLSYIPFFFLGHLIRTDERNITKKILWSVFLLSSLLTAAGYYIAAINIGDGSYFYGNLSITVIPMSVSIMYLLKSWTSPIGSMKFTRSLSLLTLGVYLIHPIFIETIQYFKLGPLNFYPAVSIPIISIIVFSSSLIAAWVIYQVPYLKRVI